MEERELRRREVGMEEEGKGEGGKIIRCVIIYNIIFEETVCERSYVGSSVDCMKTRMSNYKNHLNYQYLL